MGRVIHIFIDGEIKLKYLCYSEFHAWKQSSGISYLFYLKRNEQNTSIWNTKMQLQNLIFFNYVFLTLFKRTLFKCLHLLINSDFLFKQFSSLIELIIQSFSVKQRLHLVELAFPLTLSTIDHLMVKSILSRFNFQMYFDNSVLFWYFEWFDSFYGSYNVL